MNKKENGFLKVLRYFLLTCVISFGFISIIATSGSGGGSGGTPDTGGVEPPIPLKTNMIRLSAPGDAWYYNVSGTSSYGDEITGTIRFHILPSTKQSPVTLDNCMDMYIAENLTYSLLGTLFTEGHSYFLQDMNGSVYEYGVDIGTGDTWVISPSSGYYLSTQSPVDVGQSNDRSVSFDDGSSIIGFSSVDAIETVSTEAGAFETYRISTESYYEYANGDKLVLSITEYLVPGIGNSVKVINNGDYYSGGLYQFSLNYTATLTDTTVDY